MIEKSDKKKLFYIYALLAAITFFTYIKVPGNNFTCYDDNYYVTENFHTQAGLSCDSIKWAFTTNHTGVGTDCPFFLTVSSLMYSLF